MELWVEKFGTAFLEVDGIHDPTVKGLEESLLNSIMRIVGIITSMVMSNVLVSPIKAFLLVAKGGDDHDDNCISRVCIGKGTMGKVAM